MSSVIFHQRVKFSILSIIIIEQDYKIEKLLCFTTIGEPQDLSEALGDDNWKNAMDNEFDALIKKQNMALSSTSERQ